MPQVEISWLNSSKVAPPPEETEKKDKDEQLSPEDEIANLKDKVARTFAEMENQRRRFEKEKDEAFEYGDTGSAYVFTNSQPVPEPLTILGAGTAIGFGAFFKRKLAKKNQKQG